jgi:hypothetical protein
MIAEFTNLHHFWTCSSRLYTLYQKRRILLLSRDASVKFVTDSTFHGNVLERIIDSENQIGLKLDFPLFEKTAISQPIQLLSSPMIQQIRHLQLSRIPLTNEDLETMSLSSRILSLSLEGCKGLTKIPVFKSLEKIEMRFCHDIVDIAPLSSAKHISILTCTSILNDQMKNIQNVQSLFLYNMEKITNLPNFPYLTNLTIHSCPNFTGIDKVPSLCIANIMYCNSFFLVSPLRHVKILRLRGCHALRDISSLENVQRIDLTNCKAITDVRSLRGDTVLLDGCSNISDISALKNVRVLDLSYCDSVDDVSMLKNVSSLSLNGSNHIANLEHQLAGNFKILNLNFCNQMDSIVHLGRTLKHLVSLTVSRCYKIDDVSSFGHLEHLDISHCFRVSDVSMLGNLKKLNVSYCTRIRDVSALHSLHTLDVCGCINVKDISMLGSLHTLNISECSGVTDVSSLGNLNTIYLLRWHGVKDISPLVNVKNLYSNCLTRTNGEDTLSNVNDIYM